MGVTALHEFAKAGDAEETHKFLNAGGKEKYATCPCQIDEECRKMPLAATLIMTRGGGGAQGQRARFHRMDCAPLGVLSIRGGPPLMILLRLAAKPWCWWGTK